MQKKRFGRTGHMSSRVIFGAFSVGQISQQEADAVMESVLEYGINHIDVAPSYHDAEERLRPWLETHRSQFFLGCKTQLRGRWEAWEEINTSLEKLGVSSFDLLQLHAVTSSEEMDKCFAPGGAMEALLEARAQGLTRFLGITSHGLEAPRVQLDALERFDFDSVLFPLNGQLWSDSTYRQMAEALLQVAAERDVGTMVIKALAKGPWGEREPKYHTWYEPFDDPHSVAQALRFALSQAVTGVISSGDARLVPMILAGAEKFEPMSREEQAVFVDSCSKRESIFD